MAILVPTWAAEIVGINEADGSQPVGMDGINVVLNRARLAQYITLFSDDRDIRDLLTLDDLADATGLPLTSTGLAEEAPGLWLRPFRLWEYSWLYKTLRLFEGRATVLDLGGPGTHLSLLAALAGCQVTSIDVNEEFVRAARDCAASLNVDNLRCRVGDMRNLSDFESESFDVVISCSVLEHLTAHDQEIALAEADRVLKPGGVVGLTFDYGRGAPGANRYLPPPHDPPASAAEVVRRYARNSLSVLGNPFSEDPVPGSLFHDDAVRYTVASLFLVKGPAAGIALPQPEPDGSVLQHLSIDLRSPKLQRQTLASRAQSAARRLSAAHIGELERAAAERLSALNAMDASFSALQREADARERGLHELTAIIAERDARIEELERVAAERLSALNAMDASFSALQREADAREHGLHELTAIIAKRDARIIELQRDLMRAGAM
jgi:SAM-dependent methyltransferase